MITSQIYQLLTVLQQFKDKIWRFGTLEQLKQGQVIKNLHAMAGSKLLFQHSNSLFLILVGLCCVIGYEYMHTSAAAVIHIVPCKL